MKVKIFLKIFFKINREESQFQYKKNEELNHGVMSIK